MSTDEIVEFNQENFQEKGLSFKGVLVVDFWSPTCLPCKQMTRILEELVLDSPEQVQIAKVNADVNPGLVQTYNVRALPTLLFFKDGQLQETKTGVDRKP